MTSMAGLYAALVLCMAGVSIFINMASSNGIAKRRSGSARPQISESTLPRRSPGRNPDPRERASPRAGLRAFRSEIRTHRSSSARIPWSSRACRIAPRAGDLIIETETGRANPGPATSVSRSPTACIRSPIPPWTRREHLHHLQRIARPEDAGVGLQDRPELHAEPFLTD